MPREFYNFTNKSEEAAELSIFDEIHPWWGVGAKDFWEALQETTGKDLDVYINSPGGSVFEGYAITNMLIQRAGVTRVHVLGMAASISSVIAMAADPGELHMPINSAMFVHLPFQGGGGNEDDLEKAIGDLKKIKEGIISAYQRHCTLSREEIEQAMRDETLYTAEECAEVFGAIVQPLVEIAAKFDQDTLSPKALAFYDNVKTFTKSKSEETPSGDKKNKTSKEGKQAMSKELEAKVSSLETEKSNLVVAHKAELESNATSVREEVQNAETSRCEGINALRDKYNKDGDLDAMTIKALSDGVEVSDFKDQVLEHITTNRANTQAKKPGEGEEQNSSDGEDTIEGLEKKISETSDSIEKGKLVQKIRALRKAEK